MVGEGENLLNGALRRLLPFGLPDLLLLLHAALLPLINLWAPRAMTIVRSLESALASLALAVGSCFLLLCPLGRLCGFVPWCGMSLF